MEKVSKETIFEAIVKMSSQNPITVEETKNIISSAIIKAFNNKYNPDADLEVIIDEKNDIFKLFNNSKLVIPDKDFNENDPSDRAINISLKNALKINPNAKVDDLVREEVDFSLYSKTISQQIRQIITQTIRERKKDAIFTKYKNLKGEMIDVVVSSITNTFIIFQLEDKTIAFMPNKFRNPRISLAVGQKTKVYVENILEDSRDAQIIVSNGSREFVKRVLEMEVPEIESGIVEVVSISRQPGMRSKVAVKSNNVDVDPVGTIIGAGGSRINAIIEKLKGEKIDVILYSDNLNNFIANSLSPAKVVGVCEKYDEDDNLIENQRIAIVPNTQLTLAIGKKGNNAKLAVELTKMRIDVISIDQARDREIAFDYNVGLTQQQAIDIDNGIRVNGGYGARRQAPPNKINYNEFDSSIANFNETITKSKSNENNFDIDEKLFSDEKLREIESAFENDDEIEKLLANQDED